MFKDFMQKQNFETMETKSHLKNGASRKKQMSRLSFLLILLFLPIVLFGQERINRENLKFDKKSKSLTKATGWEYNAVIGKWIDYNNFISQNTAYKKGLWSTRNIMSIAKQQFINIQTKSVIYKGTEYFVLIIEKWDGVFENDYYENNIREIWKPFRQTFGYVFSKEEYQKLHNIENLIELKTKYMVSLGTEYEKYNEREFLGMIETALEEEKSENSTEYTFPVLKSTEGTIRFYVPDSFSLDNKYDFDKRYFETSLKDFSKIIVR